MSERILKVSDRVEIRKVDEGIAIQRVGCEKVVFKTSFRGPPGVKGDQGAYGAPIDDVAIDIDKTWSSSKISAAITDAISELVGSAPSSLDSLQEIALAISNNPNFATDLATLIGGDDDFTAIFNDGLL